MILSAEGLVDFWQAGDALYLPEGWWHQVDSGGVTVAVNFWWRSAFDARLGSHMDVYYLRRLAQSLTDAQKAELLQQAAGVRMQSSLEPAGAHGCAASCAADGELPGAAAGSGGPAAGEMSRKGMGSCGDGSEDKGSFGGAGRDWKRRRRRPEEGMQEQGVIERLAVAASSALERVAEREDISSSSGGEAAYHSQTCCTVKHALQHTVKEEKCHHTWFYQHLRSNSCRGQALIQS